MALSAHALAERVRRLEEALKVAKVVMEYWGDTKGANYQTILAALGKED